MPKYSDKEIAELITESKILSSNWLSKIRSEEHPGHTKKVLEIKGIKGNNFHVIWRQNIRNQMDFCIILGFLPIGSNTLFKLKRYDGMHRHKNLIEKQQFYAFHIHTATERYQEYGTKEEDKYAEETDRFNDIQKAFDCLLEDCGFVMPETDQLSLL